MDCIVLEPAWFRRKSMAAGGVRQAWVRMALRLSVAWDLRAVVPVSNMGEPTLVSMR